MDTIRQAAQRLEELRRAGVEMPWTTANKSGEAAAERTPPAAPNLFIAKSPAGAVSEAVPEVSTERATEDAPEAATQAAREAASPEGREADAKESEVADAGAASRTVTIDLEKLAAQGILDPNGPRNTLRDEFRVIKRPLIANAHPDHSKPKGRSNLIMVTSALPGEGKTFTSVNLAMSIAAERNCHVLLVDCDPVRPSTMKTLGLPEGAGLFDRLQDPSRDLSELLLKPTNVERLTLLPVGQVSAYATEFLASDAMDTLMDELSTRFSDRIIIFDAPPLLNATESHVLATRVGQVVFVVAADRTPQGAVKEALTRIEACPIVLPLLNMCRSFPGSLSYGYGYGYGYGYDRSQPGS